MKQKLIRFFAARFARGEYLGLHLTLGLTVSLLSLWIFREVAESVIRQASITRLDLQVFDFLARHSSPTTYGFWSVISSYGSGVALGILAAGTGVILAVRRRWFVLAVWIAAFVGVGLIDASLKLLFRRPRPPGAAEYLSSMSWSFPSGHSMSSLVGYGMLAYLLVLTFAPRRTIQIGVIVATICLVLAIGISRMSLGVHYFSDVMGGYAAGTLWLSICISGLEVVRRLRRGKTPVAAEP